VNFPQRSFSKSGDVAAISIKFRIAAVGSARRTARHGELDFLGRDETAVIERAAKSSNRSTTATAAPGYSAQLRFPR